MRYSVSILVAGFIMLMILPGNAASMQPPVPPGVSAIPWNFLEPDSRAMLQAVQQLRSTEPLLAMAIARSFLPDAGIHTLLDEGEVRGFQRALRSIRAEQGTRKEDLQRTASAIASFGTPLAWLRLGRRLAVLTSFQWPHHNPSYLVVVEGGRIVYSPRRSPYDSLSAYTPNPAQDVDGDGLADLVLPYFSMGASCCANIRIITTGPQLRILELGGMRGDRLQPVRHPHLLEPLVAFVEEAMDRGFSQDVIGLPFHAHGLPTWQRVTPQGVRPAFGEMALPLAALGYVFSPQQSVVEAMLAAGQTSGQMDREELAHNLGRLARAGHHAAVRTALRRPELRGSSSPPPGESADPLRQLRRLLVQADGYARLVPRGLENGAGTPPTTNVANRNLPLAAAGDEAALARLLGQYRNGRLPVAPRDWVAGWLRETPNGRPLFWFAGCGPSTREQGLIIVDATGTVLLNRPDVCVQNLWATPTTAGHPAPIFMYDEAVQMQGTVRVNRRVLHRNGAHIVEIGSGIVYQRERIQHASNAIDLVRFDRMELIGPPRRPSLRILPVLETYPEDQAVQEAWLQAALPQITERFGLNLTRADIGIAVRVQPRHVQTPLQPWFSPPEAYFFGRLRSECSHSTDVVDDESTTLDLDCAAAGTDEPRPLAITFPPRMIAFSRPAVAR